MSLQVTVHYAYIFISVIDQFSKVYLVILIIIYHEYFRTIWFTSLGGLIYELKGIYAVF